MKTREPGQVRKEAALSGHRQAPAGADRSRGVREEAAPQGTGLRRRVHGPRSCRRHAAPAQAAPVLVGRTTRLDLPCPPDPRSTAATAPARSPTSSARSTSCARSRNAVEQGKVHHAYLFVGSRGTGKTSMAKILAACLNCVNGPDRRARAGLRLVRGDRQRHLARRDRDGRRLEQLGRRHPRPAREGRLRARSRAATRSTSSTRPTCSPRRPGTRS